MAPKLSIIIPNYNEKENIQTGALDQVASYLAEAPFTWEVIISDDGSTDGSRDLVETFAKKSPGFRLLRNFHGGKAAAVNAGIKAAKGEIILFADMDQSTPLKEVEKLLSFYDQGYDVVFGSRGKARKNSPLTRKAMSFFFRHFRQLFLLRNISDTQCGFKSMRSKVAKYLFPKLSVLREKATGWTVSAFDVELLFLAEKAGYKLKEVEVDWRDRDVSTGKSKNFFTESVDMLKQIITVKVNDLKGLYHL
ncbi:MAG: glycosyltransferase [Patescibacteria group bacterium]